MVKSCLKKNARYNPYIDDKGSNITQEHCQDFINKRVYEGQWGLVQGDVTRFDPRGSAYGEFCVLMEFVYSIHADVKSDVKKLWLCGYDHYSLTDSSGWIPTWVGTDGVAYGRALSSPRRVCKSADLFDFDESSEVNMNHFHNF